MSTADLRLNDRIWAVPVDDEREWSSVQSRGERLLPLASGICLMLTDVLIVVAAFLVAYWARFVAPDNTVAALDLGQYLQVGVRVGVITSILFAMHGMYDEEHPQAWPARLRSIISSVSTALVLGVTVGYFVGDPAFSRLWFATGWALAAVGLVAWRNLTDRLYLKVRAALIPMDRVLIVGANRLGEQLAQELADRYQVVGYVDNGSDLVDGSHLPLLGTIAQLEQLVSVYDVKELIIALPTSRREQVSRLIARGFHSRVKVKFLPDLGELLPRRIEVQELNGRRYLGFASKAKVSWLKRVLDLAIVSVGLVLITPLLLAVAIAIKLDSPGSVFYRQHRIGMNGRRFWMYKFRSMRHDADRELEELREHNEAVGPLFKIRADPRVTNVGRVLRRWSLDELPQLLNVLKGEMSLVGPRPPIPAEVATYEDWQLGRLRAVPGLTGLWQVSGRSEVPFHDMVRLDLHYICNWSLALDLEILLRTVPAVLTSRGAY